MFFYRDAPAGPTYVTQNLLFYVDAGIQASYSGTGSIWYDLSGKGNNATFIADRYNLSTVFSNPSYDGQSITFNSEQAAYIPDVPTRINGENFTWEGVIYFANMPTNSVLASKREPTNPYRQFNFGIIADAQYGGDGTNAFFFQNPDNNTAYRQLNYNLSAGGARIVHMIIVNDSTSCRMYIDGILVGSSNASQPGATFNFSGYPVLIGWRSKVYMVRAYDKTLAQQEITQNFNSLKSRFGL